MLLEFSCSNHRSIKDRVTFSLVASRDTALESNIAEVDGVRVLRSAVVYGANGSGKSSFITAISFVKALVVNSVNYQPGEGVRQDAHKSTGINEPTFYDMQFVVDGIRYAYGFTLKQTLIDEEYLYFFPSGRQAMIFERSSTDFRIGSKFKKSSFSVCRDVLRPNRLLLSCAANFASVDEVNKVFRFFTDDLVVYNNQDFWMDYTLRRIKDDVEMRSAAVSLLRGLGLGIEDIRVSIDKQSIEISQLPPILSDDFKQALSRGFDSVSAKLVYRQFETDLIQEESTGVKKLVSMVCPLLDIMGKGKTLVCDELEANLHESIVYELVRAFSDSELNESAQLLFTTHETGLLDFDLFRRDQIWFTEMRMEDRSTDLYSLAEVKNVRRDESFKRGYISGRYGALPMLNSNFADALMDSRREQS